MRRIFLTSALLGIAVLPATALAFVVPSNDGLVTDQAGILTEDQEATLEQTLIDYDRATTNQIAVLIVQSLSGASLAETAVEVGRVWGVGTQQHSNGIIMLISLDDHEVTIKTGYGLEGAFPDIVVGGIMDTDMVPPFREGKYFEGIAAAIDSIKKHIGGEYTAERYESSNAPGISAYGIFIFFILLNFLASFLARSSSWWMGGVLGGIMGIILTSVYGWWITIPILTLLGLLFDYIVSKNPNINRRMRRGVFMGGGRWGGGRGGGGFGGFGGGSFGGGGASRKW